MSSKYLSKCNDLPKFIPNYRKSKNTTLVQYVRNPMFLTLPSVNGQQKFVGLHRVTPESCFVALSATTTGQYIVDWGDGSPVEYINSTVQASHQYNYTTYDVLNTTIVTHNGVTFKQAIVTVTPFNNDLLGVDLNKRHPMTTVGYTSGWLDIAIESELLQTLTIGSATGVIHANLERFVSTGPNVIASSSELFYNCYLLAQVSLNTSQCINFNSMCRNCYSLTTVPLFDTSKGLDFSNMFNSCNSLTTVPLFNTSLGTNFSGMFYNCNSLTTVPLFDTSKGLDFSNMFYLCYSLTTVPLFNTSLGTNFSGMIYNCNSLTTVPLFDTSKGLDFSSMFNSCNSLTTVPLFDTSKGTNFSGMFYLCYSLTTVPLFNTSLGTNFNGMFYSCNSLTTVPLFNTSLGTNFSYMFYNCYSLTTVPLFNTSLGTNFSNMFYLCRALSTVPLFNTSLGTNFSNMFYLCRALSTVPLFNTSRGTTFNGMFDVCTNLVNLPALDLQAASSMLTCLSCPSLSKVSVINSKLAISYSNCNLSQASLVEIFSNLLPVTAAKSITITGNWGVGTSISKSSVVVTQGSTVINMANTSGLAVGMLVFGTGTSLTTAKSCTFTTSTNLVTVVSHGLSNGDIVAFPTVVSVTSIAIYTPYYVISATSDTFQLSLSAGGPAMAFNVNGSGTMKYRSKIASINTNVSITLDRPCTSTSTITLVCRELDMSLATLKNWTVTG